MMLPIHLHQIGEKLTDISPKTPILSISFDTHKSTSITCIGGCTDDTRPCTSKRCPIYTLCKTNKPLMRELLNPFIPTIGYTILDKNTAPEFFL